MLHVAQESQTAVAHQHRHAVQLADQPRVAVQRTQQSPRLLDRLDGDLDVSFAQGVVVGAGAQGVCALQVPMVRESARGDKDLEGGQAALRGNIPSLATACWMRISLVGRAPTPAIGAVRRQ
jgi:hypothetical protein